MHDTITVHGFVTGELTREPFHATKFTLGQEIQVWDARSGYLTPDTNFYTAITRGRTLSANVFASLKVGDRVIVTGKLKNRYSEKNGRIKHEAELVVESIGHDLSHGTASFERGAA